MVPPDRNPAYRLRGIYPGAGCGVEAVHRLRSQNEGIYQIDVRTRLVPNARRDLNPQLPSKEKNSISTAKGQMDMLIRRILAFVLGFTIMWGLLGTQKALSMPTPDKPSAFFCWMARGALAAAGSEAAAERQARAKGVSEATISKAKRCPR